jgi:two-component system response regulator FlrC
VRELENVMRRAMVLCADHVVTPAHLMFDDWLTTAPAAPLQNAQDMATPLPVEVPPSTNAFEWPANLPNADLCRDVDTQPSPATPAPDLQSAARLNEHQVIMATLAATPSKTEAAKRLGISPRTLRYKLAQLREHGLGMVAAC